MHPANWWVWGLPAVLLLLLALVLALPTVLLLVLLVVAVKGRECPLGASKSSRSSGRLSISRSRGTVSNSSSSGGRRAASCGRGCLATAVVRCRLRLLQLASLVQQQQQGQQGCLLLLKAQSISL